ncbi:MAG TPA: response regulator [Gemmatimonadales bacterium]|nr:response regulator [Gemmatimonadales bacterium]
MYSILVVDDSVALREAVARSLTRRGCRVTTAEGGVQALELLRAGPVDVVVTDLNMPDRGGLWLWRHALVLRPELCVAGSC